MKPTDYAASVVRPDSQAHRRLLTAMAGYGMPRVHALRNPTSGRDDGVTPTRTAVVICEGDDGLRLCVKFYEDSQGGRDRLRSHAHCLRALRGVIPVPQALGVEEDESRFGLPALVTTFAGAPLHTCIAAITGPRREHFVADLAGAVAALANLAAGRACLRRAGLAEVRSATAKMFAEDARWYAAHAPGDDTRKQELVLRGAEALAAVTVVVQKACLTHRDLCAHNIMVNDGVFSAIVDWDHAAFDASERDVGVCAAGLLVTLPIPRPQRTDILQQFLHCCRQSTGIDRGEADSMALAFALDALLDWLIGGRNAPRSELAWATSVVLDNMSAGPEHWRAEP